MNFSEEVTPAGFQLKILYNSWNFLVFTKKGESIYADDEKRSLLHSVPLLVFVGQSLSLPRQAGEKYFMCKVRDGKLIVPYDDIAEGMRKYLFIDTDEKSDMIPVRMLIVPRMQDMIRIIDIREQPDKVIVDSTVNENDIIVIKNRYKLDDVIHAEYANNYAQVEKNIKRVEFRVSNLNMLSMNPVFLAATHLRIDELTKLKQVFLDFELTELDCEYIIHFIRIKRKQLEEGDRRLATLDNLESSYLFYLYLLQRDDESIRSAIDDIENVSDIAPYQTLVLKVKSIYPGKEEQEMYAEYEKLLSEKRESFSVST